MKSKKSILLFLFFLSLYLSIFAGHVTNNQLIRAAKSDKLTDLKKALKNDADVCITDEGGRTALHWAVYNNNKVIVEILIKLHNENDHFQSLLETAKTNGKKEII